MKLSFIIQSGFNWCCIMNSYVYISWLFDSTNSPHYMQLVLYYNKRTDLKHKNPYYLNYTITRIYKYKYSTYSSVNKDWSIGIHSIQINVCFVLFLMLRLSLDRWITKYVFPKYLPEYSFAHLYDTFCFLVPCIFYDASYFI